MVISPRQFLKKRRPHEFSDSSITSESTLNRSFLEYQLEHLTSKNQELDFERFAKRLCELEIAPNLMSHTGPTGGGDGKVDTETHPVSEQTVEGWFAGFGDKAGKERWGFAFSAKKDWRTKLKDDVKKLSETNRGYKAAYFVTNQFVKSKDRLTLQDELKQKYGIEVWILDRNWILDKIFGGKHEDLARDELHLDLPAEETIKKGLQDSQREEYLQELDKDIKKAIADGAITPGIVDDSLSSAIVSRQLEKDRVEIDGRFDRAERLAKEHGNEYQKFDAIYQKTWTTFWWHEDFPLYIKQYEEVEAEAGTENIYNLERLTNLWFGLHMLAHQRKVYDVQELDKHTQILRDRLRNLSQRDDRPSASLHAKAILLQTELLEKAYLQQDVTEILKQLKQVVLDSKGLIGFPFKTMVQLLTESRMPFEGNPAYDDLFDTILSVVEERDGEVSSAKLLLSRGEKLLETNRPYEAIKALGLAQRKLYKEESRKDVVRALFLCGIAYEEVGLLWAARGALLYAASHATNSFWVHGNVNMMQATCYRKIKWLELRLGRLPQLLDWNMVDVGMRRALVQKGFDPDKLFENVNRFDLALGVVFLRANPTDLEHLKTLPDTLEQYGLLFSSIALIYALGGTTELPDDFTEKLPAKEVEDFFVKWAEQYSPDHISSSFVFSDVEKVHLTSNVLGCRISAEVENKQPCLEVAESALAAIESFLSTAILKEGVARESAIKIIVLEDAASTKQVEYSVNDDSDPIEITIRCKSFNPHSMPREDQASLADALFDIVVQIVARIVMFRDPQKDLEELMRDEGANDRALNFTGSFITLGNVLGHHPSMQISDWVDDSKRSYPLTRTEPVSLGILELPEEKEDQEEIGKDARLKAKHSEMETISIIRDTFWDEAKWKGAGYIAAPPEEKIPPVMSLLFTNVEPAKKIFEAWRKKFGKHDVNEVIRVSVVTGIDKKNPTHYRVGISTKLPEGEKRAARFIASTTRMHTMTPTSLVNLEGFKRVYERDGFFWLVPGYMTASGDFDMLRDLGIAKREISFREAWQIGPHDPDMALIDPDEEPIIPEGVKDAPVLEALKLKKHFRE